MTWRMACAGLLVAGLVMAVAPASAQPGRGRPQPEHMRPADVERTFDDLVLRQARQRLELDRDQMQPFTERVRALQMVRRRGIGERLRLLAELGRLAGPRQTAPDEAEISARLAELSEFEARQAAALRQAYSSLDEVLTPVQRARFRVLEEQLERRKIELITRARKGRPPGDPD